MNATNATYCKRQRQLAFLLAVVMLSSFMACALYAAAELFLPSASGDVVFVKDELVVDASHADQGYLMAKHDPDDKPLKLRLTCGKNSMTYDFEPNGAYDIFPLQFGNGSYKLEVFRQVSGKRYTPLLEQTIEVALVDETLPYLYPNQYVNFTWESEAVLKSYELCYGADTEMEKYQSIYRYMANHMIYDFDKARSVKQGYLPVVDDVLFEQKGICFDLSALMAAMLRAQGIPTQLVIGYADKIYHAWNMVYLDGQWILCDITSDIMCMDVGRYTTERFY